jgi:hypothetical protein
MKEDKSKWSKYLKETNPSESKVNQILNDGYILHSVSVIPAINDLYKTRLVYHFILDLSHAVEDSYVVGIDLSKNDFISKEELDLNSNPFLDFRDEE